MARPETLTVDALSKVLSHVAQSASVLANKLGVSRATVHRKLLALASEQIVVKDGMGPRAGYRLPTPAEEFERARASKNGQTMLRLEVSEAMAYAIHETLEFSSRIGIGQFHQLDELFNTGAVTRFDGQALDYAELEEIRERVGRLSTRLDISHGIYSPHVALDTLRSWEVAKVLRHRLAWDRNPEGSMGVWHDEPQIDGTPQGVEVYSLRETETRYVLELDADNEKRLLRACSAFLQASSGRFDFIVEWAQTGELRTRNGARLSDAALGECAQVLKELSELVQDGKGPTQSKRARALTQLFEALTAEKAKEQSGGLATCQTATDLGDVRFGHSDSSAFALSLDELPTGMLLNFFKGGYRVIAPSTQDGALVIVGSSHSVQTAIAMARNYAKTNATRSWGL